MTHLNIARRRDPARRLDRVRHLFTAPNCVRGTLSILALITALLVAVAPSAATAEGRGPLSVLAKETAKVEHFSLEYEAVPTPKEEWDNDDNALQWFSRFRGRMVLDKPLKYRRTALPAGRYDVWIEPGKKEWFYLVIGKKDDKEQPRLRAQFKIYDREEGVEKLRVNLKLVRKATKLKFSILVGKGEGHGNLRIVGDPPPKS